MSKVEDNNRASKRLLALRKSTLKPTGVPKIHLTERETLLMLGAVEYVCQNQPYIGWDDNPHQSCKCAGRGPDGLPICTAHKQYSCENKSRLLILRKKLSELRKEHGGSPVSPKVDGGCVYGVKVVEGETKSEDIPNPNEPTHKQVRFANAIMKTLGLGFPHGFDFTRKAYSKLISDNVEAWKKKRKEIDERRANMNSQFDEDCPFDQGDFC